MLYSRPIVCGFAIFFVDSNEVKCLMMRRSESVSSPSTWSIPIGHAEGYELADYYLSKNDPSVLLKVALRELKEETNLEASDIGNIYNGFIHINTGSKDAYIFSSIVDDLSYDIINNKLLLDYENDDFMWFELDHIDCSDCLIDIFSHKFDLFFELFSKHFESLGVDV